MDAMKTKTNIQRIGIVNCQGLLPLSKQRTLADDFMTYIMAVLCIQETNMQGCGLLSIKSSYGKNYLLYYSGHQAKSIDGVGILVEKKPASKFRTDLGPNMQNNDEVNKQWQQTYYHEGLCTNTTM